jgi:hypothetical protein
MMSDEIAKTVVRVLEALKVPYLLVGSFATNIYGIPRSTKDADFVVQLGDTSIHAIMEGLGEGFRLDPQMSFESVTGTTRYLITRPENTFTIEIFLLSDDPHDQERFQRRRQVTTANGNAVFPTVEDVIITKLRWATTLHRSKDRDDLQNVLAIQSANIDWDYVHHWCDQHRTRELLDEIRRETPQP